MKYWALAIPLLCAASAGQAQPAPTIPELVPIAKGQSKIIVLRWLEPALVASWLDPQKYPLPESGYWRYYRGSAPSFGKKNDAQQETVFDLPDGLESWKPLPEKKAIEARGTQQALEEFEQLLQMIDQPLKRVEIEADLYNVSEDLLKRFALVSAISLPLNQKALSDIFFVGREQKKLLDAAVAAGDAKLVNSTKRTILNNSTVKSDASIMENPLQPVKNTISNQHILFLTPTVNGDGTNTVLVRWENKRTTTQDDKPAVLGAQNTDTIFISRDGDTVALSQWAPPGIVKRKWLYVLTPHKVAEPVAPNDK